MIKLFINFLNFRYNFSYYLKDNDQNYFDNNNSTVFSPQISDICKECVLLSLESTKEVANKIQRWK